MRCGFLWGAAQGLFLLFVRVAGGLSGKTQAVVVEKGLAGCVGCYPRGSSTSRHDKP